MSADDCGMELRRVAADDRKRSAVCVRHAYKRYGDVRVLQDFDMTIEEGTIYCLLGASGCGKTTLLSCLVGRRWLDSGDIRLLGFKIEKNKFVVPRKAIGYMPQEDALYRNFTIKEIMQYFGWIFSMTSTEVEARLKVLLDLLDLPERNRIINNLSGGQKRRLSLAVALLHDPAVMILDEPTVGLDPVLRSVIWEHLLQLSGAGKTIIITTHYIEEARQAHKVGMIRSGRLLAEESPQDLMHNFGSDSLEEVFMRLSERQEQNQGTEEAFKNSVVEAEENVRENLGSHEQNLLDVNEKYLDEIGTITNLSVRRMRALLNKNCKSLWRDLWLLVFLASQSLAVPACLYFAFSQFPHDLPLAVVIHDRTSSALVSGCGQAPAHDSCDYVDLSCRFAERLAPPAFRTEFFNSTESAEEAVRRGHAWATVYFGENFTTALAQRNTFTNQLPDDVIDASMVTVRLDMSDYIIGLDVARKITERYVEFLQNLIASCEFNPKLIKSPLRIKKIVYGQEEVTFIDYLAPSMILFTTYFFGVALSVSSIVTEKVEGLLERDFVAGVTSLEVLVCHFLAQVGLLTCQVLVLTAIGIFGIGVHCLGSPVLVVAFVIALSVCGLLHGLAVSLYVPSTTGADVFAMSCLQPLLFISGNFWPLEAMNSYLRMVAPLMPLSLPIQALRSVMSRGTTLLDRDVYMGFVAIAGWSLVYVLVCAFAVARNKL